MSVAWEEYGNYATDVFTRQAVNVIEVSDFNHLPPILCCCHPLSPNILALILSGAHDKPIAISCAFIVTCHLVLLMVSGHQKHNSSQPIFLYVVLILILILVPYLILLTLILSGPQHQPALVPLPRPPGRPLRQHLLSIAGDT